MHLVNLTCPERTKQYATHTSYVLQANVADFGVSATGSAPVAPATPTRPAFGPGSAPVASGGLPVVNGAPGAALAPTHASLIPHTALAPAANGFQSVPTTPTTTPITSNPSLPPPRVLSPPPFSATPTSTVTRNVSSPPPPPPPVVSHLSPATLLRC